jgi:hypothetical protein
VYCTEKVSDSINHTVVRLLSVQVGGTSTEVVTTSIELELFSTTTRERILNNDRDLDDHGRVKECLSGTNETRFHLYDEV